MRLNSDKGFIIKLIDALNLIRSDLRGNDLMHAFSVWNYVGDDDQQDLMTKRLEWVDMLLKNRLENDFISQSFQRSIRIKRRFSAPKLFFSSPRQNSVANT